MKTLSATWKQIRRSPYQSVTAILVLSMFFVVGYALSFVVLGGNQILHYFETRPQVIAFFRIGADQEQINTIAENLRTRSYVESVTVVTKEQALELYRTENSADPLLLELVTADILPASIEVSATSVEFFEEIENDLAEYTDIVDETVFQRDVVDTLVRWTTTIRTIGLISTSVLGVASILVMVVVISSKVANKRREILTMRLLGATNWFIQRPFMMEGVLYGVFTAVVGWVITQTGLLYATPWITEFFGEINLVPVPLEIVIIQLGIGVLFGVMLGLIASSIALRRFVK